MRNDTSERIADSTPESTTPGYEPPRVEDVVTADDLAREIQYAGIPVSIQ